MERTLVDGVPVLWAPAPGPLTAGLVLGVGRRDESVVRGGLTHLVEHLAMRALGRTTLDCNATVDVASTQFTATGSPEQVTGFLRSVCAALADLPTDGLPAEAGVLRAEGGMPAPPALGALLSELYGAQGVGLAGFREPALHALTADDVRDWAAERFVRGNAALWLTGPPPPGLALPLPDGPRPAPTASPARDVPLPALVEIGPEGQVALGAEAAYGVAVGAACRVLRTRVEDELRHRRGLSYVVMLDQVPVAADRRFVAVTADCHDGREPVAARALWQELRRLAEHGPAAEELAHDLEGLGTYVDDPRAVHEELHEAAVAEVTGREFVAATELRDRLARVTPAEVAAAAAALRDGALVGVPFDTEVTLAGAPRLPTWSAEAVTGEAYPRRRGGEAPRGARLVVGDDGVSVVLNPSEVLTVRWADARALLELGPGESSLLGADGISVPLSAGDWQDGQAALARVRAAVPVELQAQADAARSGARRVVLLHAPPQSAQEALWPSKHDTWVRAGDRWTVAVREVDEQEAYAQAAGMSASLGRRGAALLLSQEYGELHLVLMHRGKERGTHVWDGQAHDAAAELVAPLGDDAAAFAELLAHPGEPAEVLAALTERLGVPEQAAAVLSGMPAAEVPGLVHERPRGVREAIAAAARGDYDPPESTRLQHRLSRWERERPTAYRLVNGVAAAVQAAVAVLLAQRVDGDLVSGTGALTAFFGLGAVGSLWSTRPPKP